MKTKILLAILVLLGWNLLGNEGMPVANSPGMVGGVGVVETRCPTFSWSGVAWAQKYRVVVLGVEEAGARNNREMKTTPKPVLSEHIAGGGLSWTPSASLGLSDGNYAWCVGAMDADGAWVWSEIRRFRVDGSAGRTWNEEEQAGLKQEKDTAGNEASMDAAADSFQGTAAEKKVPVNDPKSAMGTEGTYSTFYGTGAGANTSIDETCNSFFGSYAGNANTTGASNTFIGREAGIANTTGASNTFIGRYAGLVNTTADANTFIGTGAGRSNTTGFNNTFLGSYSGNSNSTGSWNLFLGFRAGRFNTIGGSNTYVGRDAGHTNSIGSGNVFLGSSAGYNEEGSDKLYIHNNGTSTPLIYGDFATNLLKINGSFQVTGLASLNDDTTVTGNIDVSGGVTAGSLSLDAGTTTINASEINILDGKTLATGASGNDQLVTKGYVDENDDVGTGGLTGSDMTDKYICKWDDANTRLVNSLLSEAPGTVSINGKLGIGTQAPLGAFEIEETGVNAVFIFERTDGAKGKFTARPNEVYIGTGSSHPGRLVANNITCLTVAPNGNVGIGSTDSGLTPTQPLHMANGAYCSSGGVWTNASSISLKENISALTGEEATSALQSLNPVKYNYKADKEEKYVGFIAEEVPELVARKDRKGLSPMDIVAVLTKVVQEQQKTLTELKDKIAELKRESQK